MTHDFSRPQRQSAIGILIMAGNAIFHILKALFVPLMVALMKADTKFTGYFFIGLVLILMICSIYAYLSYRRFTFYLDENKQEFVINKGVFNLTQLVVQLDKIQQVNIDQNLLQKVIGIYGLKIDTAGAEGHEVSIQAIPETLAHSLRDHLLSRKNIPATIAPGTQSEETEIIPLLKISTATLFKTGLTSNYGRSIGLLLAFIYPLYHTSKELLQALKMDQGQVENLVEGLISLFSVSIILLVILFIIIAINVIGTLVRYFDLQISKHRHSLLIAAGLFAKKNTLLNPDKVHITAYSQNYFQKKLNLLNVNLKQATSGHQQHGKEMKSANLEIPGCNAMERDQVIGMILGKVPPHAALFVPDWRFLNLPVLFKVVLPLLAYLIFALHIPEVAVFWPLCISYAVIAVIMIYISYKKHRLTVDDEFIVKQSGIWDITKEIILPHKIQAITTFQYPWHRSADVGHVNLHTAAGVIHFKYGNYTEIKQLVNFWLYQVERDQ